MLYLYGAHLAEKKKIQYALAAIHGIGYQTASLICSQLGFGQEMKVYQLTENQISSMCQLIEQHDAIEGDLKKEVRFHLNRLVDIGCYRGLRHAMGLPLRGQRTHTNGRTQKRLAKRFKKG